MSLQTIIDRINDDVSKQANETLAMAQERVKERLTNAQRVRSTHLQQLRAQAEKDREITRNLHISEARREARRNVLEAKEEEISECFRVARVKLSKLTGEPYQRFLNTALKLGLAQIDGPCYAVLTREEDRAVLAAFPEARLKVDPIQVHADGLGGFILKSGDGLVQLDLTFEGILERRMAGIRTQVAQILFKPRAEADDRDQPDAMPHGETK